MENQAQTSQLKSYYNCEHCGRIYKRKSSLQHHITIKHEEITLLKVKLQNEHLQLKYSLMMDQVMCFKQHFQIQENMLKAYRAGEPFGMQAPLLLHPGGCGQRTR